MTHDHVSETRTLMPSVAYSVGYRDPATLIYTASHAESAQLMLLAACCCGRRLTTEHNVHDGHSEVVTTTCLTILILCTAQRYHMGETDDVNICQEWLPFQA